MFCYLFLRLSFFLLLFCLLLAAISIEQVEKIVVENILAFDEVFWIRLAARSDTCKSEDDKARVSIVYVNDRAYFHALLFPLMLCGRFVSCRKTMRS